MKILILGLNYFPEKVGIAVYTTGMAEDLAERGHDVNVISGQPYYPAWRIMDGYKGRGFTGSEENGVKITRTPHYIPAEPTGKKRLIHHATFGLSSFIPMIWKALTFRPDVILSVAPSLVASPVANIAAFFCRAKTWLHIQDFEVEAAFATGLLDEDGKTGRIAKGFETGRLRSFDRVSSISPQMCRKLVEKKVEPDRIVEFRNWSDIDKVKPLNRASVFRERWGIQSKHVALYSGNIANKQGIDIVVDAARALQGNSDLTFVVCGEGPNRVNLEAKAQGLSNIQFHDLQPYEDLNELMGLATIHLLPQLAGAADLVLPSKLTNMLASGKPVVATAVKSTGLADEVSGCGVVTEPEVSETFADAILSLTQDSELYEGYAATARKRAEERWAKARILERFERQLEELARDAVTEPARSS